MKKIIFPLIIVLCSICVKAQHEVELRTDGIVIPRTDTASVQDAVEGMMIYDTTRNRNAYFDGAHWRYQSDNQPCEPTHVGSITGDAITALEGASSIFVSGNYAYVASLFDAVIILDISDPSNPTHVGSITDDATTELDGALSIVVRGNYAYVASFFDNGVEILDISDPTNPTHVGGTTDDATTVLHGASSIVVRGNYAYVASKNEDGVEILDISDPSNPTHVGSITDDATTELDGARSIVVRGNYAYVASEEDDGVEILDISDPSNPTHVGSITDDATTELDGARSIVVHGNYAYIASDDDNGVEILDISDFSNPIHVGSISDDETTALNRPLSIVVYGSYAYITSFSEDGIAVLNISEPSNPTHVGSIFDDPTSALNGARSVFVSGSYAYVAAQVDIGVEILDICGSNIHAADIGNIKTSQLNVTRDVSIGQQLSVGGSIHVGGGFVSNSTSVFQDHVSINTNSGSKPTLDLIANQPSDSARIEFSNISTSNSWHIAGKPSNASNSTAELNFWYSPVGNNLQLFGDGDAWLRGELSVQSLDNRSDRRLKKNISPLESTLDKIKHITGYQYNWTDDLNAEVQIGLIAQEVQEVLPELVKEDHDEMLSVRYLAMIPILLEAIKEQRMLIDMQEVELSKIKSQLKDLMDQSMPTKF